MWNILAKIAFLNFIFSDISIICTGSFFYTDCQDHHLFSNNIRF